MAAHIRSYYLGVLDEGLEGALGPPPTVEGCTARGGYLFGSVVTTGTLLTLYVARSSRLSGRLIEVRCSAGSWLTQLLVLLQSSFRPPKVDYARVPSVRR